MRGMNARETVCELDSCGRHPQQYNLNCDSRGTGRQRQLPQNPLQLESRSNPVSSGQQVIGYQWLLVALQMPA